MNGPYSQEDVLALQTGIEELQRGDFARAEARLRALTHRWPEHGEAEHLLGLIAYKTGRSQEGLTHLLRAVDLLPDAAMVHNNLGTVLISLQQPERALSHYLEAARLAPDYAEAWRNLGNLYKEQGLLAESLQAYRTAARLLPGDAGILAALAAVHVQLKQPEAAEGLYQQALALNPANIRVQFRLGELYRSQRRHAEAIGCYQQVLSRQPRDAGSHNSLGHIYFKQKDFAAAEAHYRQALEADPSFFGAANNLGCIYFLREQYPEAELWVRKALAVQPDYLDAWENLAGICRKREDLTGAVAAYTRLCELSDRPDLRVRRALLLPVIYDSEAEIPVWREKFAAGLRQLLQSGIRLRDPSREIEEWHSYLHYAGPPWLDLALQLAEFYRRACPELVSIAPHCRAGHALRRPGDRLRLGIVAPNFKGHSVAKMFGQIVPELDRARFEVVLCTPHEPDDSMGRYLANAADEFLKLPEDFFEARAALARRRFDILLYPEIGGDRQTYFFGFSRLAPLQAVLWGIGSSTGLPEIDCFFSTRSLETEISRRFYSETLIESEHLLPVFIHPVYSGQRLGRADFSLPQGLLYACLQSPFKLHPVLDPVLRRILEARPDSHLVLLENPNLSWFEKLQVRLRRTLGESFGQVIWMPRQSQENFLQLAGCCDLLLDTLPICGGNTTYDTLVTGTPLITLTGPFSKNRVSHAVYAQIGLTDLVCESPEAYCELAIRLGGEPGERERLRQVILQRLDRLYERREGLREFEDQLYQAYFQHRYPWINP
ncbi:MAG TPA: tetratricopeptide repeat protein [Candidatus Obscuribacterales bacterium]